MNIDEWEELMEHVALPADEAIKASEISSEKIEVTTLSDPEPRYIEATKLSSAEIKAIDIGIHYGASPVLKATQLYYIATCIIITERRTHTSHNYCIYDRVPLDSLPEFKGLQELIEYNLLTRLNRKGAFMYIRCFTHPIMEMLFQMVEDWFKTESLSEEIDYREIIS